MAVSSSLLLSDSHRSVVGQVQRTTRANLAYSPYGRCSSAGHVTTRFGFTGQLHEPLLDAYALGNGHRFYSVALSRFQRPDALSPFGKGGIQGYGYCGGDPVNRADPTGQFVDLLLHPLTSALVGSGSLVPLAGLQMSKKPSGFLRRGTQIGLLGAVVAVGTGLVRFADPDAGVGKILSAVSMTVGIAGLGFRSLHYIRDVMKQGLGWKENLKRLGNLYIPGDHNRLHRSFALHAQREGLWHRAPDFTKEAMKIRAK